MLHSNYFTAGCDNYSDEDKADFDSNYHTAAVVAACIKLCLSLFVSGKIDAAFNAFTTFIQLM